MNVEKPSLALLGGSFNPPHIGHFRIALEAAEILKPEALHFVPCSIPPHKPEAGLLPFSLRVAMLRAGIEGMEDMARPGNAELADGSAPACCFAVNEIEHCRPGPSYTVDTLSALAAEHPDKNLRFIMGSEDYAQFPTWRRWKEITELADIVVLPRGNRQRDLSFAEITRALLPEAKVASALLPGVSGAYRLPHGRRIFFLHQPYLDISSSLARERFLAGRSLDYLVPPGVVQLLRSNEDEARRIWTQ
ncbi:nicotinate-nicotinamide nucleotide adenylyltransferase [Desulfovibrio sp. OttesenSCG-928-A18]|nr:nicotinate-nicotinamide nucleotide adenylyltransferase [Desulfovibrio sp. OttesenSCG-928-A18]